MKKLHTIAITALLTVFAAAGAHADNANTGFDPILDADFLEVWSDVDGVYDGAYAANTDPMLNADFVEFAWVGLPETGRVVALGYDPILDADFGPSIDLSGSCEDRTDVTIR
jgi:hypothetical protein